MLRSCAAAAASAQPCPCALQVPFLPAWSWQRGRGDVHHVGGRLRCALLESGPFSALCSAPRAALPSALSVALCCSGLWLLLPSR